MTFQELLQSFIGHTAEFALQNQTSTGTIDEVTTTTITETSLPTPYGPGQQVIISMSSIDFVRILS